MRYILDDKKILKCLSAKSIPIYKFLQQIKMTQKTLDRALDGMETTFSTVMKFARAFNCDPNDLIREKISPPPKIPTPKPPPPKPDYSQLKEYRYGPR